MSQILSKLNVAKNTGSACGKGSEPILVRIARGNHMAEILAHVSGTALVDGLTISGTKNKSGIVISTSRLGDRDKLSVLSELSLTGAPGDISDLSFTARVGNTGALYQRIPPSDILTIAASTRYPHKNQVSFNSLRPCLNLVAKFDQTGELISGEDYSNPGSVLTPDQVRTRMGIGAGRLDVIATISEILTGILSVDDLKSSLKFTAD